MKNILENELNTESKKNDIRKRENNIQSTTDQQDLHKTYMR